MFETKLKTVEYRITLWKDWTFLSAYFPMIPLIATDAVINPKIAGM